MGVSEICKRIERVADIIQKDARNVDNQHRAQEIKSLVKLLQEAEQKE